MKLTVFSNFLGSVLILITANSLLGQPLTPTQWSRIRTPYFDVIFRDNITQEAQRVANTLQYLYEPVSQSLGIKPPRISVVLRNEQVISNGDTSLAPRKMILYTFPNQDYNFIGTNTWLELLLVHEFRHVVQYAKLKQNFNKQVYKLAGDLPLGAMIMFNVPFWLLEGDAVNIETALTQGGRGRIPKFSLLYRTNLLEQKNFSYAKQVLGSFKEPVPDRYTVGYYLTTYLRRQYGAQVCADILEQTTRPRLFYSTIRKITGKKLSQIYKEANQELKSLWETKLKDLQFTQATKLNLRSNTDYTDYAHPQFDKEGSIIALRSGISTVPQFVRLDSQGKERTLFIPGDIDQHVGFSVAQNQIVWVEKVPDLRWENRSYKVIQRYDNQTKRLKALTYKSRYGSAALSPDATQIVAFESDESYNHQLVILNAENGHVLQRFYNPDNHFYLTPRWSEDGGQIVVVKNVQQRVTITLIDVSTGETRDLLPYSTEHIGFPVMKGQYVLYNGAHSGIDNIYAIDLTTNQRYQVTSRKYGAYNPIISADGCWIIFNDFTKDGMDTVKMPFDPSQWTPLKQVEDRSVHYHAPLIEQEGHSDLLTRIPNHIYPTEPYLQSEHLINIHSWLNLKKIEMFPWNKQQSSKLPQKVELNLLSSNDLLDTHEFVVDYSHFFKDEEQIGIASAKINYKGCYPQFCLNTALIGLYRPIFRIKRLVDLTAAFPLNFVRGQYTHKIQLSTKGTLYQSGYAQSYHMTFKRHSKKSPRDIYHPWQQEFSVACHHVLPYRENSSQPFCRVHARCYFPGLEKHHALCLALAYEQKTSIGWLQIDNFWLPNSEHAAKTIHLPYSATAQYDFPIYYPDWTIGHLGYVKRFRARFSYIRAFYPDPSEQMKINHRNIAGVELLMDVHWLTLFKIPQCSVGINYFYDSAHHEQGRFSYSIAFAF